MTGGPRLRRWGLCAGMLLAALALPAQAQAVRAVTEATPYTYLRNGKVEGPVAEVVERTLQRAGVADFAMHLYPWARAYDMALHEPGVLIFLIARTPARENLFHWTAELMTIQYHLYRLRRNPIDVPTLDAARTYSIGVMRDDVRHQFLQAKGFTRLVVSAQSLDNFRKLIAGQVDLVPLTTDDATALCAEARFDCDNLERVLTLDEASTSLYMAYNRQTAPALVERTRRAFEQLKAEGTVRSILARKP